MSAFVHTQCACGVEIIAVSSDEDDVRIAVASHNEGKSHQEWRAVQDLRRKPKGHCICRDVTNSPHTPQEGATSGPPAAPFGQPAVRALRVMAPVKMGHSDERL